MQRGGLEPDKIHTLEPWARLWQQAVSIEFLQAYLAKANAHPALALTNGEIAVMLPAYLFTEAMHEIDYELATRPDWLHIPLTGILSLIGNLSPTDG